MTLDAAVLSRIAAVSSDDAEMMRKHPAEATVTSLSFYRRFKWVRVMVALPTHPVAFNYADDGARMLWLGRRPDYIYRVNDEERLQLGSSQVAPYVRFFLNVTGDDATTLAEREAEVPWLPASEQDEPLKAARAEASAKLHVLRVSGEGSGYRVLATVIEDHSLVERTFTVTRDGRVAVVSTTVLIDEVPVSLSS